MVMERGEADWRRCGGHNPWQFFVCVQIMMRFRVNPTHTIVSFFPCAPVLIIYARSSRLHLVWTSVSRMAHFVRALPSQFTASRLKQMRILNTWLIDIDATPNQRKRILKCLDEGHLLSLPRCERIHKLPKVLKARNWRILFYSNLAFILGWRKRIDFPDEVFHVVRERWLDEDDRASVGEAICMSGGAGATANPIARVPTAIEAEGARSTQGRRQFAEPSLVGGDHTTRNIHAGQLSKPREYDVSPTSPPPPPPANRRRLVMDDGGSEARIVQDPAPRSLPIVCSQPHALVSHVECAKGNSAGKAQKTSMNRKGKQMKTVATKPAAVHAQFDGIQRTRVIPLPSKEGTTHGRKGGRCQGCNKDGGGQLHVVAQGGKGDLGSMKGSHGGRKSSFWEEKHSDGGGKLGTHVDEFKEGPLDGFPEDEGGFLTPPTSGRRPTIHIQSRQTPRPPRNVAVNLMFRMQDDRHGVHRMQPGLPEEDNLEGSESDDTPITAIDCKETPGSGCESAERLRLIREGKRPVLQSPEVRSATHNGDSRDWYNFCSDNGGCMHVAAMSGAPLPSSRAQDMVITFVWVSRPQLGLSPARGLANRLLGEVLREFDHAIIGTRMYKLDFGVHVVAKELCEVAAQEDLVDLSTVVENDGNKGRQNHDSTFTLDLPSYLQGVGDNDNRSRSDLDWEADFIDWRGNSDSGFVAERGVAPDSVEASSLTVVDNSNSHLEGDFSSTTVRYLSYLGSK